MTFPRAGILLRFVVIPGIFLLFAPGAVFPVQGVKTSYKQYSLFTYNDRSYLCEPYRVKKNEWLYKIFRQKGEISASDFPLFLNIFKAINPQIRNIDAITPGSNILIPLRQVDKNAYEQDTNGTVEVPVLEFSAKADPATVSRYTHKHKIKSGDTLSQLLSKEFLTAKGNISKAGKKVIFHLNPKVSNLNCIYQGATITIPDPSMLSKPWFNDFLALGTDAIPRTTPPLSSIPEKNPGTSPLAPKPLSPAQIADLKRYTQLIHGRLMHQGQLFLPSPDPNATAKVIDLSKTPVISDPEQRKTILLGPGTTQDALEPDLVAAMKAHWHHLEFKTFSELLSAGFPLAQKAMTDIPKSQNGLLKAVLTATPYSYEPQVYFPISLNNVQMTVCLGRLTRDQASDMLINGGNVYGQALDVLKDQGYQILDLPADLSFEKVCTGLFSRLGYQVCKNPPFNAGKKIENIPGVYAEDGTQKYFFTRTSLFENAATFLENENIKVVMLDKEPAR